MTERRGVSAAEKYAELEAAGLERPRCECHGEPMGWKKHNQMKNEGCWRCRISHNEYNRSWYSANAEHIKAYTYRYYHDHTDECLGRTKAWRNKNPEKVRRDRARRVCMSAGGLSFYIGSAPTVEAAEYLRKKIREEAPK